LKNQPKFEPSLEGENRCFVPLQQIKSTEIVALPIPMPKKKKKPAEDVPPEVFLPSIRNIILDSHYRNLLSRSNYVELDHEIALWLNYSWTLNPGMVKACARLLEEMILTEKNKSLLILDSEIYSRLLSLDTHYEKISSGNKGNFL
jgi:hypothetical protein